MGNTKEKVVERARRADNGQYTTKEYAKKNPNTTVTEKDKIVIKTKTDKSKPKPKKSK